jgi:flagellar biogenesis protein FliO
MSRATIVLLIIVLLIIGALAWLSRRSAEVPPHPIEKVVTLNGAANAAP